MHEQDHTGYLPSYEGCIICGERAKNPHTLNLRFKATNDGVEATYKTTERQEGYKGIIHGGITSALLDETIGWACAIARKKYFFTVELSVRFTKPLPIGVTVIVKGRHTSSSNRFSEGEGEIMGEDGTLYAKAKAKYFLLPDDEAAHVHSYLTFRNGDIDILA